MSEPVLLELDRGLATITLDRPEAMNSLDVPTKQRLLEVVTSVAEDRAVRAVLLTGTGRAFCVGQDLNEHVGLLREGDPATLFDTVTEHYNPIVTTLATMPKPVVCALNGVAAGAGASLALACDLRLLAESAGFNFAFAGIGLSCDTGSSWTLPRLVGREKALELLYLPRTVRAAEAVDLGLASKVVPDDALMIEARALGARLAAGPTVALGAIRRAVARSAEHSFTESLVFEGEMMTATGATQDHAAAVEAFLAKEKPDFHGR